jgi:hypothetical protein
VSLVKVLLISSSPMSVSLLNHFSSYPTGMATPIVDWNLSWYFLLVTDLTRVKTGSIVESDFRWVVEGVTTQLSLLQGGMSCRASVPTSTALRPSEDEVSASSLDVAYFLRFFFFCFENTSGLTPTNIRLISTTSVWRFFSRQGLVVLPLTDALDCERAVFSSDAESRVVFFSMASLFPRGR